MGPIGVGGGGSGGMAGVSDASGTRTSHSSPLIIFQSISASTCRNGMLVLAMCSVKIVDTVRPFPTHFLLRSYQLSKISFTSSSDFPFI